MKMLESAQWYMRHGLSVFPVREDKKPMLKEWKPFQTARADEAQVAEWWRKTPGAGIAIVTGEISGLMVVDVDSEVGNEALQEFLPDAIETPVARTPSGGWHYFFKYKFGLVNKAHAGVTDCDVRTDGGYVVAAPSYARYTKHGKNIEGPYQWLDGLSLGRVEPAAMPDMLFDVLAGPTAKHAGARSSAREHAHINKKEYTSTGRQHFDAESGSTKVNNSSTFDNKSQQSQHFFEEGTRDEALFHLANCLARGGMSEDNLLKYLFLFANKCCSPPFPESEARVKVQSALKSAESRSTNITANIREFLASTSGNISSTDILHASTKSTLPEDRRKISAILSRMVKDGEIERVNGQNGIFRRVENDCEPEDWLNAECSAVDLWLPFGLNEMIEIPPGSIILVAGAQDAGKSSFLMNIARYNMHKWKTHYFSSELNRSSFKSRVSKFPDYTPSDWKAVKFYQRTSNFHDVIKTGPNDLNLIDYLEVHDNFYQVAGLMANIHKKLGQSIAVIGLQKDPNAINGRGGSFTQEKPVLSISLDYGKATIAKFKGEFRGENPRGKQYLFKLVNGCQIREVQGWHRPHGAA